MATVLFVPTKTGDPVLALLQEVPELPTFQVLTSTRCGATRLQQRITWSRGRDLLRTILSMASPSRNRWRALLRSWVDLTSPTRREDHKSHNDPTQKEFDLFKHREKMKIKELSSDQQNYLVYAKQERRGAWIQEQLNGSLNKA